MNRYLLSAALAFFIMDEFIHIVKENVLNVVNLVSLWRRCGVEPGRDEGAAV